ncbi:MAG: DUF1464 domain-containing protein [Thermoprotei archaeon]|nr:MAG: DUF1464 domain-containing protein [Thermoprotei archaeon]
MVKGLGIDPGTMSFDIAVVENDRVVWEKSISTVEVAKNPSVLVKGVEEAGKVDVIAGPSGYGTPVVWNEDIIDPRVFATKILLLTDEEDIRRGVERGEFGMGVYDALTKVVVELWRRKLPVCYIPSVILLPTVPSYRKINKLDMGTADKMAIAVLAVYDQASRLGLNYGETSFILVEMGFGYNAVMAVNKGKIIDGLGGTLVPTGFLTVGPLDAELAVAGKMWERSDVFYGGVSTICRTLNVEEAVRKYVEEIEPFKSAFESMFESLEKSVRSLLVSLPNPKEIIISGRLTRMRDIRKEIERRLGKIAPVVKIKGLKGAKISKEAAQGYAIVAEGLGGGYFRKLIEHMEILKAKGTVMSWVHHPRLMKAKEELREAYRKSVKPEKQKIFDIT